MAGYSNYPMECYYDTDTWDSNSSPYESEGCFRFVKPPIPVQGALVPPCNIYYYPIRTSESARQKRPFRFLDLPKEIRLMIYEYVLGGQIIDIGYYHSVYTWNAGRSFIFAVPRLEDEFIKPENHVRILYERRQQLPQLMGYPPTADAPQLDSNLLKVSKLVNEESREVLFKRNVFVLAHARSYNQLFWRMLFPMQSAWVRFLTIVLPVTDRGIDTLTWRQAATRPLPNLTTVHFFVKIESHEMFDLADLADTNGVPRWWEDLHPHGAYRSHGPFFSAEDMHEIPNFFRLLVSSKPSTTFTVTLDLWELKRGIFCRCKTSYEEYLRCWQSEVREYEAHRAAQLDKEGYERGTKERLEQCVLGYMGMTEEDEKAYVDEFRRRLTERPMILEEMGEQDVEEG